MIPLFLIAGLAALFLLGHTMTAALPEEKTLLVGDSEARYVAPYLGKATLVQKDGTGIDYWSGVRLDAALADSPSHVVVFLGTNDYWRDALPDTSKILASLRRANAKTLWVGPMTVRGKNYANFDALKKAVTGAGFAYLDSRDLNIPQIDGVHPTPEGARTLASAIILKGGV